MDLRILPFFLVVVLLGLGVDAQNAFSASSPLRALVPLKVGFTEFVSWAGSPSNASFDGFSVQVFEAAVQRLPFSLPYVFVPFGNGSVTPKYDDMVQMLQQGRADAIVADLTITRDRMRKVDFTQPYVQSALVMITPFTYGSAGALWDFLRPFSKQLWITIIGAFFATGFVVFVLEHKNPDFHRRQPLSFPQTPDASAVHNTELVCEAADPKESDRRNHKAWMKRLINVYWFTSLSVFFSQQESVTTHTGRFVTLVWLLVVLIFTSSYTASLASTLSAQQPYPTIQDFNALLKSNVAIGYQGGSFVQTYLAMLGISQRRLKPLASEADYANALSLGSGAGGVGAIVDELPYIETFLASECDYTMVGDQIAYFGGFGFAFAKNSTLTDEISMGILSLAQDGGLQRIKDSWVGGSQCSPNTQATHLRLRSFGGLFLVLTVVYGVCVVWRVATERMKATGVWMSQR